MGPTLPTSEYFFRGLWGWLSSTWVKLSALWGFSDTYYEKEQAVDAGDGTNTLTFSTVPAGEVWVVEHLCHYSTTTDPSRVAWQVYDGTNAFWVEADQMTVAWVLFGYHVRLVLKEGDRIRVTFYDVANDPSLYAYVCGYKMSVA